MFEGKRTRKIHSFTKHVDPGYEYIKKFRDNFQWYLMESKDFISSVKFKLKTGYGNLVSFNGQSITFRLSIKEI